MPTFLKKSLLSLLLCASILIGGTFYYYTSLDDKIIIIESEESKNEKLESVFNQIRFIPGNKKDVWMMNQSHFGANPPINKWERLAIVIDKSKKPMTARYYQLSPGELEWSEYLTSKRVNYRASCFTCHSNGPRAIRPIYGSTLSPLGFSDQLKVQFLNLRIKTYGRIKFDEQHKKEDLKQVPPFHYSNERELEPLKIKTCLKCHSEDGFFSRGHLVRQQSGTINHLVEAGHMPPTGFKLSHDEKKQLRDFLRGF